MEVELRYANKLALVTAVAAAIGIMATAQAAVGPSTTIGIYTEADMLSPLTGNNTTPSNWRVTSGMTFNGTNFDGVARLRFDNDGSLTNGAYICSGTLLSGGLYVLTAAHCADDFNVMELAFGVYGGVAAETRSVAQAFVHPGWSGSLSRGNDIAIIQLNAPVTTIQGFNISTSNDVGQEFLIMGHGTTGVGNSTAAPNWGEYGWMHWGRNKADATVVQFLNAAQAQGIPSLGTWSNADGEEYVSDYDGVGNPTRHNTLGRITGLVSNTGLGADEALIAGGDSGGGDFVWNGSQWLVSGVHSWGWQFCGGRLTTPDSCDFSTGNSSSWGDVSGSTAVFSHAEWIATVTGVPEPGTYAMMLAGLGVVGALARRRKAV